MSSSGSVEEPLESSAGGEVLSSANKQAEPLETTLDQVQSDESSKTSSLSSPSYALFASGTEIEATSSPSPVSEYEEGCQIILADEQDKKADEGNNDDTDVESSFSKPAAITRRKLSDYEPPEEQVILEKVTAVDPEKPNRTSESSEQEQLEKSCASITGRFPADAAESDTISLSSPSYALFDEKGSLVILVDEQAWTLELLERRVICQEEDESAVNAHLGESFESFEEPVEAAAPPTVDSGAEIEGTFLVGQRDHSGLGYRSFTGTGNSSEEFGSWEKHTRGIGSSLLLKWGFQKGKGLGKTLQGMPKPVEFSIQKGLHFEPIRKEEIRVLSICFNGAKLGAALFNTVTGKLELLKDIPEEPPKYEMLTSLVSQVDPHVILVSAMQDQTLLESLKNLCGTADNGSRTVSLVKRPGIEFGLNSCVNRVKSLEVSDEGVSDEQEKLAKLSAYVDFTCYNMVRASGALLKYVDQQRGASIIKDWPSSLLIDSPGQKIIKFFVTKICTGYITGTISKLI